MNNDWTKLKQSANGLPTWDSFIPYALEVLKQGEETTRKVLVKRIFNFLEIPTELRVQGYPDSESSQSVLSNRIGFALTDLYKAKAIIRPQRAVYQITEKGKSLLDEHGDQLTPDILEEQVVVKLLDTMGYSGKHGSAEVTNQSNDGGIDGIINQDPLGTSTVFLQVKRYAEKNVVGRPAVQSFYGALASVNADRGVFITTSSFSKGAQIFAENQGIVLIDGIQLTELMLEYKVGVEQAREYVVYQIDHDYFESEE